MTNSRLVIATGGRNKMFTLRHLFEERVCQYVENGTPVGLRVIPRDWFMKTLSHDWETALKKAKEYSQESGIQLDERKPGDVQDIAQKHEVDHSIIPFRGKHPGESVFEVAKTDPEYLAWIVFNFPRHEKLVSIIRGIPEVQPIIVKMEREIENYKKEQERRESMKGVYTQAWKFLADSLRVHGNSYFCQDFASKLDRGDNPLGFSDKVKSILADIYAKDRGRRGSKAYKDAYDWLFDALDSESYEEACGKLGNTPCKHNEMVPNDEPGYAWKCAVCGYVFGNPQASTDLCWVCGKPIDHADDCTMCNSCRQKSVREE